MSAATPLDHLVLLRISGEVSTKAKITRKHFVTRILRNARDALSSAGIEAEVERRHARIFLRVSDPGAVAILARVFGLQSVSLAEQVPLASLDELVDAAELRFRDVVRGKRFAVRARLVGGERPGFKAREVEVALGARLLPLAARVDLSNPEVTAQIECYEGSAYLFTERVEGPAGLPLGSEGRAVALVSGGFDSAVAAWQLQRRGVGLDYVFCNLGGRSHRAGTVRVMHEVAARWSYGWHPRLHAIDFDAVSRDLQKNAAQRYWQVILKRLMLRAAEAVARANGGDAIITGEAVGQVSSQTLVNLRTISEATDLPILRPLVGFNKNEIIGLAEHIGTAPLSAIVQEYCALVPSKPATAARLPAILEEERKLDPAILERAIEEREILSLRRIDPDATSSESVETSEVPEGAVIVDLRSRREYDDWHPEGALHMEFGRALDAYPAFGKDQHYLLYCEFGLKSAHLAELMQEHGLRAHHFKGGTRALRRHLDKARS